MTPEQLQARYAELKAGLDAGRMTPDAFRQAVFLLRYQAADGRWYTLDAADGGWLWWDGAAWQKRPDAPAAAQPLGRKPQASAGKAPLAPVPASAGPAAPAAPAQPAAAAETPQPPVELPRQFWPLLRLILGRTFKTFMRRLPLAIAVAILMSLALIVINFCIITFKNDGYEKFTPNDGVVGLGLGLLRGSILGGLVISIGSVLVINFLSTVRRKGLGGAVGDLAATPRRVAQYFSEAGPLAKAGLAGGAGVALVLAAVLNSFASLAIAAGLGALLCSNGSRVLSLLMRSAWDSTYGTVKGAHAKERQFTVEAGYIAVLGSSVGFILRGFLGSLPWYWAFLAGIGLLGLALFLVKGGRPAPAAPATPAAPAALLMLAVMAGTLLLRCGRALAHDGGPWEFNAQTGGSLWDWVGSPGFWTCVGIAIKYGVGAGGLGGLLTGFWSSLNGTLSQLGGGVGVDEGGDGAGTGEAEGGTGAEPTGGEPGTPGTQPGAPGTQPGEPGAGAEPTAGGEPGAPGTQPAEPGEGAQPPAGGEPAGAGAPPKPDEGAKPTAGAEPGGPAQPPPAAVPPDAAAGPTDGKPPADSDAGRRPPPMTDEERDRRRAEAESRRNAGQQEQRSSGSWWGIFGDTLKNIKDELVQTGGDIKDAAVAVGGAVKDAATDVYNDPSILTDTFNDTRNDIRNGLQSGLDAADQAARDAAAGVRDAARDVYNDPRILVDTITGTGQDIKDGLQSGAGAVVQASRDAIDAAGDVVKDPQILTDTVGGMASDIGQGAKDLSGLQNFENSWDPNRSLPNRLGQVGLGVLNLYGALQTAGAAGGAIKGGASGLLGGAAGEVGSLGDDAIRIAAGGADDVGRIAAGGADDVARAAAGGADDVARAGAAGGAADDAGRAAAGAVGGTADDAGRAAAGAAGGTADDAGRAAAGAAGGTADDAGRAAAGAAGGTADDAARAGAGAAGATDDAARAGAGAAGTTDDAARAGTGAGGTADDAARQRQEWLDKWDKNKRVDPSTLSDEEKIRRQSYTEHLRDRNTGKGSTIRPGDPSDLAPATGQDVDKLTAGYTQTSQRDIQMVADKNGVQIHTRPTTEQARELLANGEALPKPELVKNKTINKWDTYLGAKDDEIGKVGHFLPEAPPARASCPELNDSQYQKVVERFYQRADEFHAQSSHLTAHADELQLQGRLVIDKQTGLPFTGDVDGYAIRGMHGETLPQSVVQQVERELKNGPGDVMHGVHTEWDYSKYGTPTNPAYDPQKFQTAQGIDSKIRGGHAAGGEALVTYRGGETQPSASWWQGGTGNPLIKVPTE